MCPTSSTLSSASRAYPSWAQTTSHPSTPHMPCLSASCRPSARETPPAPPPALAVGFGSTVLVSALSTMLLLLVPLGGLQLHRWRVVARLRRREAEEAARINPRRDHPNVRSRASEGGPLSPKHAVEHRR
mmetsp:Transcript_8413/g.27073  ORF Transcript_8413/g.27073 Transcript_8413/m.27073 type:complete len:130 (-) Transcript_8413:24-413(-)